MRIGIISEGHSDRAVIQNVLLGFNGLDGSDLISLRPKYKTDETDKALKPKTESSWSVIQEECEEFDLIEEFLSQEGNDFIVIHIDTAEADKFGVNRPDRRSETYNEDLREAVIDKIKDWLKEDVSDKLLHAVAIEETDAWILTIYDNKDSSKAVRAKEKLQHVLGNMGINSKISHENYLKLSKLLSKPKEIKKQKFLSRNYSLKAFYEEIEEKVVPKIIG